MQHYDVTNVHSIDCNTATVASTNANWYWQPWMCNNRRFLTSIDCNDCATVASTTAQLLLQLLQNDIDCNTATVASTTATGIDCNTATAWYWLQPALQLLHHCSWCWLQHCMQHLHQLLQTGFDCNTATVASIDSMHMQPLQVSGYSIDPHSDLPHRCMLINNSPKDWFPILTLVVNGIKNIHHTPWRIL